MGGFLSFMLVSVSLNFAVAVPLGGQALQPAASVVADEPTIGPGASPHELDLLSDTLAGAKFQYDLLDRSSLPPILEPRFDHLQASLETAQAVLTDIGPSAEEVTSARRGVRDAAVATGEGLYAYEQMVAFLEEKNRSGRVGVYVAETESGEPLFAFGEDEVFASASTYKLFIAYSMIKSVDEGKMSWSEPFLGSRTLGECFEDMIVHSDNACPEHWISFYPVSARYKEMEVLGTRHTQLTIEGTRTTPRDMVTVLRSLLLGELISRESGARLREAMINQEYREGIPAALEPQVTVGDKVGFLGGLLHDVAFVESPRGDFLIAVFTEGQSWRTISDVTGYVYYLLPRVG